MPNNQVLKPAHPPLVPVTTSASHTSAPESGAKPEPPPRTSPETTAYARITWPVPHIMVYYRPRNAVYAYGRKAIADMGKLGFLEWMYRWYVWTPKMSHGVAEPYQNQHFQRSRFKKDVGLVATFYHIHGASDAVPLKLSALGWADMIQNVVKLEVWYDDREDSDEGEEQPLLKKG